MASLSERLSLGVVILSELAELSVSEEVPLSSSSSSSLLLSVGKSLSEHKHACGRVTGAGYVKVT